MDDDDDDDDDAAETSGLVPAFAAAGALVLERLLSLSGS
jgi:hypothetical protein